MKRINREMGRWTMVYDILTNSTKSCMAACHTTSYSNVMIGSSSFPNSAVLFQTKESCIIARKLLSTCRDARKSALESWYPGLCEQIEWLNKNNEFCLNNQWNIILLKSKELDFNFTKFTEYLTRYISENVAVVKVFMKEPFAEVLARNIHTTETDFVSDIGGLLGLSMGFSFVTLAEIMYYSCKGLITIFNGRKMGTGLSSVMNRKENEVSPEVIQVVTVTE